MMVVTPLACDTGAARVHSCMQCMHAQKVDGRVLVYVVKVQIQKFKRAPRGR